MTPVLLKALCGGMRHFVIVLVLPVIPMPKKKKKKDFWGILESACLSISPCVRPSVYVSVCEQYTSSCQSAGGSIKSHSVTAVVHFESTLDR